MNRFEKLEELTKAKNDFEKYLQEELTKRLNQETIVELEEEQSITVDFEFDNGIIIIGYKFEEYHDKHNVITVAYYDDKVDLIKLNDSYSPEFYPLIETTIRVAQGLLFI